MVIGSVPKWKAVMGGIPQGLVLGLVLFNILIHEMSSGVECILNKLINETKLCGAVNRLEGRDASRGDLDRLERPVRTS